ncbi:hypothetical protein [Mesorhizobium sp. Root102]|uniref:hypothetical protein n=1 Tax=Mesorhizobium sp. Root102 TaxID=1736422 RepID=UPI001FCD05E6|nr:hypothetical protein [Mesorhizobium sp. Root102]
MSVHVSSCVLSGCAAAYLNHYDSVTLVAGDTANLLLQTVDPFDPNTHIEGDGQRIAAVQARGVGLEENNAIAAQDDGYWHRSQQTRRQPRRHWLRVNQID